MDNLIEVKTSVSEALANIKEMEKAKSEIALHIRAPFKVPTPKEKVQKRPDGYDYVEHSWMDNSFKTSSPLYSTQLVHKSESLGWIDVIVSVTDRITGNNELGGGSAKIQVAKGTDKVLDKGNNLTAALSKAIKNAQSRFGHAADVYHKLHELPTDGEKERYESMLAQLKSFNLTRSYTFEEQWGQLGIDFSDYLDRWQIYIDRNTQKSKDTTRSSNNQNSLI